MGDSDSDEYLPDEDDLRVSSGEYSDSNDSMGPAPQQDASPAPQQDASRQQSDNSEQTLIQRGMTSDTYPLFTDIAGNPMNFRLVCSNKSEEIEYVSKITAYGGACQESDLPRILLVSKELAFKQSASHPLIATEPAFQIIWIDHCLQERSVIDIKGYLLNPCPKFVRIDYMERIYDGAYKALLPSVEENSEYQPDDFVLVELSELTDSVVAAAINSIQMRKSSRVGSLATTSQLAPANVGQDLTVPSKTKKRHRMFSSTPKPPHQRPPGISVLAGFVEEPHSNPRPQDSKKDSCPPVATQTKQPTSTSTEWEEVSMNIRSSDSDEDSYTAVNRRTKNKKRSTVSSASHNHDFPFGPSSSANVEAVRPRQNTRRPYTRKEELAILKYMLASKKISGLSSNVLWKQIDGKPGIESRTWQSLKNHFLKFMIHNLEQYNLLTPEQIKYMRSRSIE